MNINHWLRTGTLALLAAMAPSLVALADDDDGAAAAQKCDNVPANYWAAAGSADGVGTSAVRARKDAAEKGAAAAALAAAPCALCPNGDECRYSTGWAWQGSAFSTPVLNPATGLWECTYSWTGCTVTQQCVPCD